MRSERGFALLTVLWVIVALSTAGAAVLLVARTSQALAVNRRTLTRAAWARDACAAILLGRYDAARPLASLDSTDLGSGAWCRAHVVDPGSRLNLNIADRDALAHLLGSDSLADALVDWRDADTVPRPLGAERSWYRTHGAREPRDGPFADVGELIHVRGFDSRLVARMTRFTTTDGDGRINLNAAPAEVLATVPGLDPAAVALVLARRHTAQLRSAEEVMATIGAASRRELLARYPAFLAMVSFAPTSYVAEIEGRLGASPLAARARLVLAPVAERLAVVRREVE